jgi:hypothetical protein
MADSISGRGFLPRNRQHGDPPLSTPNHPYDRRLLQASATARLSADGTDQVRPAFAPNDGRHLVARPATSPVIHAFRAALDAISISLPRF